MHCRLSSCKAPWLPSRNGLVTPTRLPFLYETPTILSTRRRFHAPPRPHAANSPNDFRESPIPQPIQHEPHRPFTRKSNPPSPADSIPFDSHNGSAPAFTQAEHDAPAAEKPRIRGASITRSERDAFKRLFNSLRSKEAAAAASARSARRRGGASYADEDAREFDFGSDEEDAELEAILARDMEASGDDDGGALARVEAYPEAIRDMAAQAGVEAARDRRLSEAGASLGEKARGVDEEQIKGFEVERTRIVGLVDAAKTDVEIWDVLEKELFSRVTKLDLDGIDKDQTEAAASNGTKQKARKVEDKQLASPEPSASPSTETPIELALLAHIYAPVLHRALHRLTLHTTQTSLALNLLPHIKALGPSSYTLGASVSFYNTLLAHVWRVYADMPGMVSLLQEMINAGLAPNRRTAEILGEVLAVDGKSRRGELGDALQKRVEMVGWRENVAEVSRWRKMVLQAWERRVLERTARAQELRRLWREGALGDSEEIGEGGWQQDGGAALATSSEGDKTMDSVDEADEEPKRSVGNKSNLKTRSGRTRQEVRRQQRVERELEKSTS